MVWASPASTLEQLAFENMLRTRPGIPLCRRSKWTQPSLLIDEVGAFAFGTSPMRSLRPFVRGNRGQQGPALICLSKEHGSKIGTATESMLSLSVLSSPDFTYIVLANLDCKVASSSVLLPACCKEGVLGLLLTEVEG